LLNRFFYQFLKFQLDLLTISRVIESLVKSDAQTDTDVIHGFITPNTRAKIVLRICFLSLVVIRDQGPGLKRTKLDQTIFYLISLVKSGPMRTPQP